MAAHTMPPASSAARIQRRTAIHTALTSRAAGTRRSAQLSLRGFRCARRRCHGAAAPDPSGDNGAASREGVRHVGRQRVQSGSFFMTAASTSVTSRRRTRACRSASRRARSRTPRCRRACRRLPARLLGRHVGRGAENHPRLRHRRGGDRRRIGSRSGDAPAAGSTAFARPKSSTFTVPSLRTLMFAGLRSRWMMPCSCAASSASAICRAIGSASSSGMAPRAMRCADRRLRPVPSPAPTPSIFEAVDRGDVRVIERREDFASRSKRASRSGSLANDSAGS